MQAGNRYLVVFMSSLRINKNVRLSQREMTGETLFVRSVSTIIVVSMMSVFDQLKSHVKARSRESPKRLDVY